MKNTLTQTVQHAAVLASLLLAASVWAQTPQGEIKGEAVVHTAASAQDVIAGAQVALPASVTGGAPYLGPLRGAPKEARQRVPVVVFMHGSSGLALKAIGEWQQWLAGMGIASLAPDSFALPNRITYKSPVDKATYEKVHALRVSEIALAARALPGLPWADAARVVLAGTSEGATAVARYSGREFAGRIIYSWSCEDNYFVQAHATALPDDRPVLNVMSSTDVFFSPSNSWLGNATATGHCGAALKANKQASVVLIPGAPHTLMNLPAARHPAEGFLRDVLKP
ncbi:MAG: alpha/beta hydrolase [Ramlibacter sp.]|nr:alpha/beta hydrolase [Ramlibacter sp.]